MTEPKKPKPVGLPDVDEIDRIKAELVAFYEPVNRVEVMALDRMAIYQHSMRRAAEIEKGLTLRNPPEDIWKIFRRYKAHTERMYKSALREFERAKKLRNEPNSADAKPRRTPKIPELPPLDEKLRKFVNSNILML